MKMGLRPNKKDKGNCFSNGNFSKEELTLSKDRVRTLKPRADLTWQGVLEKFILQKRAEGLADRTINDYRYHVTNLFKDSGFSFDCEYEILKSLVLNYFALSAKLAPITFNTRRKILKTFFTWLISEEYISENPLTNIKKRKEDDKPRAVSEDDLKQLLSKPNLKTFSGIRDYALLVLTLDTGIRPSESFGLTIKDFNLKSLELTIPASIAKTRVSRTLPLSPITIEAVKKLHSIHHPSWGDTYLFCTEYGTKLSSQSWSRRLRKYSKKAGIKVTPYSLRHSFALIFLRLGGNSFALQRELGHTTLAMTRKYVALTEGDLKKQHSLASPINSLIIKRHKVRNIKSD